MNETSLKDKGYLSSKEAGAQLGYTHDYISRLCRQGKISGVQKGREWYVLPSELIEFKQRHEVELQEKKVELSKKFSKIRREAEARKREARQALSVASAPAPVAAPVEESSQVEEEAPAISGTKPIKFVMPRELVAIAALALTILVPNLWRAIDSAQTVAVQQPASTLDTSMSDLPQEPKKERNPVVPGMVASASSVLPHIADGWNQFIDRTMELPGYTLDTWNSIGNTYLYFYVYQGELIYGSLANIGSLGNIVISGYELLGQSVVVGSTDIADAYSDMMGLEVKADTLKKN